MLNCSFLSLFSISLCIFFKLLMWIVAISLFFCNKSSELLPGQKCTHWSWYHRYRKKKETKEECLMCWTNNNADTSEVWLLKWLLYYLPVADILKNSLHYKWPTVENRGCTSQQMVGWIIQSIDQLVSQ